MQAHVQVVGMCFLQSLLEVSDAISIIGLDLSSGMQFIYGFGAVNMAVLHGGLTDMVSVQ